MKIGYVNLVGRPNTGKSTLLNSIMGEHLAIVSDKVGTTRNIIDGVYNDKDSQIVFVDTPGIHKPVTLLDKMLNKKSFNASINTTVTLFLVDGSKGIGKGDKYILDKLDKGSTVFLVINKIDNMDKENIIKEIDKAKDMFPFKEIVPISASKKRNIDELIKTIKKYLPEGDKFYEDDTYTNISSRFLASEVLREKLLNLTNKEVPYTITCYTEEFKETNNLIRIKVDVIVDRKNLKKIIIGKNGTLIKEAGTEAREDLEKIFGKKIYLESFVKVLDNWRDEKKIIEDLNLDE